MPSKNAKKKKSDREQLLELYNNSFVPFVTGKPFQANMLFTHERKGIVEKNIDDADEDEELIQEIFFKSDGECRQDFAKFFAKGAERWEGEPDPKVAKMLKKF